MLHYPIASKKACHKWIEISVLLLVILTLLGCELLQGPRTIYDPSDAPNIDHIAQNYVEAKSGYTFVHGDVLGATTVFAEQNVKVFRVGETEIFICYFIRQGLFGKYAPVLCVKKGHIISNEFCSSRVFHYRAATDDEICEGVETAITEPLEFEPYPDFIAMMEQAYQEMNYVESGNAIGEISGEIWRNALIRLAIVLPLRECPEVAVQGELLFGDDGIMYWSSAGLDAVDSHTIIVGPYENLPELPDGVSAGLE